ncbi:MAG: hypothetical protein HKN82_12650 [Akkermansiaceae bacterium]|nr:hypothetical protein [Akkermansiaceae bacterium]NNM31402.1 hypothetical protein [Akkermansiaceae bacterium]
MRRVAASLIAMTAGWMVMNVVILGLDWIWKIARGRTFNLSTAMSEGVIWAGATAVVVGGAWLLVYLPIYAAAPRGNAFWKWRVCVPAGVAAGAAAGIGVALVAGGFRIDWGVVRATVPAAAIVGGVAAVVGRFLLDWSRHYRQVPQDEFKPGGARP